MNRLESYFSASQCLHELINQSERTAQQPVHLFSASQALPEYQQSCTNNAIGHKWDFIADASHPYKAINLIVHLGWVNLVRIVPHSARFCRLLGFRLRVEKLGK